MRARVALWLVLVPAILLAKPPDEERMGDWTLHRAVEPTDDGEMAYLRTGDETYPNFFAFVCWQDSGRIVATLQDVRLEGTPVEGSLRVTEAPSRAAQWVFGNGRWLQTPVTREEVEGIVAAKGRAVVEVVTDRDVGVKKVFESPSEVRRAVRAFLRRCGPTPLPIERGASRQLETLEEFLGDAVVLLAAGDEPVAERLQIAWDDYVRHLTEAHMPSDTLKRQLEGIQGELDGVEPRELPEGQASMLSTWILRLYQAVQDERRELARTG